MTTINSLVVLPEVVKATRTGLEFTGSLSFDEWQGLGETLKQVEGATAWWRGDYLNYGEGHYGEMYAQALSETDDEYQTLADKKWISKEFEFSQRHENLSWSHHREVAALKDKGEREKMLGLAAQNNWSHRKLRQVVREYRGGKIDAITQGDIGKLSTVTAGDWWKLGEHVLYCGDTSSRGFIDNLPAAAFAFADPPYGAEVADWDNQFYWAHDYLIDKAAVIAVTPGIVSIFDFARITTMPYVWSAACWINNGMTRGAIGFGNWIYAAIFSNASIYRNSQDFYQTSVSNADTWETSHKGRKPAGFVRYLVELYSKEGETVIDPFLGSGTTLFVCDETGRRCIGGELSPEFCAQIISRWENKTGRKAERF